MTNHSMRTAGLLAAAFIVAFSGSATAAALVTGAQIANESVTGLDLKDGGLEAKDLIKKIDAKKIAGPAGPRGKKGPVGAPGNWGLRGLDNVHQLSSGTYTVGAGQYVDIPMSCEAGYRAVHGGFATLTAGASFRVQESAPNNSGTAWFERLVNVGTADAAVQGRVLCAHAG